MNREIRDEWVKRLRSGEYEQGKTYLRNKNNKYCCLGILCEMAVEEGAAESNLTNYGDRECYEYAPHITASLPEGVQKWCGIDSDCGSYGPYGLLTNDNDSGKSFKEIADIIEANF